MKKAFYLSVLLSVLLIGCTSANSRKTVYAGSFYPGEKNILKATINAFLSNAGPKVSKGQIISLVVPHAGYEYSGQVAAYSYKEIKDKPFKTVIIIGQNHFSYYDGIAVSGHEDFETPLGKLPVDRELARKIASADPKIRIDDNAFEKDHTIEVQLPFIQLSLKDAKIVPILFGNLSPDNCRILADAISPYVDDSTLVIASTDWAHYFAYDKVNEMDIAGIDSVLKGDLNGFISLLNQRKTEACAASAVITASLIASSKASNRTFLLKHANSGDATGDKNAQVVGYTALAFSREPLSLSREEKKYLLDIARKTISASLDKKELKLNIPPNPPFHVNSGVFVTLKKYGMLRGCIGIMEPIKPLYKAVSDTAISSAFQDARFSPVRKDEIGNIDIEISVLSPIREIKSTDELVPGRDGIILVNGNNSGVFLPQVATEQKWDKAELLRQIGYKAGLGPDTWKDKNTRLYTFTADVFGEE